MTDNFYNIKSKQNGDVTLELTRKPKEIVFNKTNYVYIETEIGRRVMVLPPFQILNHFIFLKKNLCHFIFSSCIVFL